MAETVPTNIGVGPRVSSVIGDTANATGRGALIGAVVPFTFCISTVAAGTDVVVARFKAPAKMRILSVNGGNRAVSGVCSFKIYNNTDSANILGSVTLTTNTVLAEQTSFTNETVDKGDEIQVLATAGTSISDLTVVITAVFTGEPSNPAA